MPLALCSATHIDVKVKIQDATPLATPLVSPNDQINQMDQREQIDLNSLRVAVVGLGYVGLPLVTAFGRLVPTIGFDLDE